jgi:hypothetical protein
MESSGGIYALHSHLNHSCTPNISIRHLDQSQFTRLTIVAKTGIQPGEELTVCYVNPEGDYRTRRREIRQWGFECRCGRCCEEERALVEAQMGGVNGGMNGNGNGDGAGLVFGNGDSNGNGDSDGEGFVFGNGLGTIDQMDLEDELRSAFGM